MLANEGFRRLMVFAALCLAFGAVVVGLFRARQLAPTEITFLGTWATAPQADGFVTRLQLLPDRTCRVQWLDRAGQDTKPGHAPRNGRWWVEGHTLFVDANQETGSPFESQMDRAARAWPFEIQEDTLVLGPQTKFPVKLWRNADGVR